LSRAERTLLGATLDKRRSGAIDRVRGPATTSIGT